MPATSEMVRQWWIREALLAEGGSAKRETVLDWIERHHGHKFTPEDLKSVPSTGEPTWRNRASWARQHAVDSGFLRQNSPSGLWELTEAGRENMRPLELEDLL
ncbi:MAG: winged helix-turn-helix domain-containing protein [Acidobacteria bacterium]|nr:winged helix-turn-helix domain-containing protein [Acidobacteriota bacterium]